MIMNESVTEFLRFYLPTFLPHLLLCESLGVLVIVGSWGGTDSGTYASSPSKPVFSFSVNVFECMLHEKPQASIVLEMDLIVCPESDYYYYYYYNCYN